MFKLVSLIIIVQLLIFATKCISTPTSSKPMSNNKDSFCPDILSKGANVNLTRDECCTKYKPLFDAAINYTRDFGRRFEESNVDSSFPSDIELPQYGNIDPSNLKQVFSNHRGICNRVIKIDIVSRFKNVNIANVSIYDPLGLEFLMSYVIHDFCLLVVDTKSALQMKFIDDKIKKNIDQYNNYRTELFSAYKTAKANLNNNTNIYLENLNKSIKTTDRQVSSTFRPDTNLSKERNKKVNCSVLDFDQILKFNQKAHKIMEMLQIKQLVVDSLRLSDLKSVEKFYGYVKSICIKVSKSARINSIGGKNKIFKQDEQGVLAALNTYCGLVNELPALIANSYSLPSLKSLLLSDAEWYRLNLKQEFDRLQNDILNPTKN